MTWVEHRFEDVPDFLRQVRRYPSDRWIYRGQANANWDLKPKAGRKEYFYPRWKKKKPQEEKYWDLDRFRTWWVQAIAYSQTIADSGYALEYLGYAQHYGLATRLLDWSGNPLVALYFAAETPPEDDGAVFCYHCADSLSVDEYEDIPDLERIKDVSQYNPRPIARRLLAQDAVFTFHPEPEVALSPGPPASECHAEFLPDGVNLVRFLVPSKAKAPILKELSDIAVHRKSLFPDLEGLSHFLNWETRRCVERDN
jgi:hypothetical protein